MNPTEFRAQIDRLTSTYGPKAYPMERTELLWNEFKSVNIWDFAEIVSRIIAENAMAPMLPKFRELFSGMKERSTSHKEELRRQDAVASAGEMTLGEWIVKAIDSGNTKEVDGFVKFFGMSWVDNLYWSTKGMGK